MHVTELMLNKSLGVQIAAVGSDHVLEMPETSLLLNHVGTIHASAQFALAEACSGELLLRQLGEAQKQIFAVLRVSNVKFRSPANGTLRAFARFADADKLSVELASRGRALASVLVEIVDAQETITMTGQYDWFLKQLKDPNTPSSGEG